MILGIPYQDVASLFCMAAGSLSTVCNLQPATAGGFAADGKELSFRHPDLSV
jgi:hypothetical protein